MIKPESIQSAFKVDRATAELALAVMRGQVDCAGAQFPKTAAWVEQCYNEPSKGELKMAALDELLGGFGVEALWGCNSLTEPLLDYLNMGDTYAPTIVRIDGKFKLTSWGDIVEQLEAAGVSVQ